MMKLSAHRPQPERYRRRVAAVLAGVLTASLALAACGAGSGASSDDNTLTLWHNATTGPGSEYWETIAADFEASHEGVTVEVQAIQNEDLDGKLQTAQNAGEGPDVFLARGGGKLRDMVEAGLVLDISGMIDQSVAADVPEGAFSAYTVDDGIYAMPTSLQPGGIYYSQDLFQAAGITAAPTTMEELSDAVAKLKESGTSPIALGPRMRGRRLTGTTSSPCASAARRCWSPRCPSWTSPTSAGWTPARTWRTSPPRSPSTADS
ncbi:ABC transporter substrate-binding protein [Actinomyces sp. 432]|uniref:ABC transporter substrate-binding protein n=1 Tax=Actinomyces sp. 432 TaxID=2057798 RepID=UPI00192A34CC|nr:extracellular solute-binding protein [Actinomyces sp. 432]